MNKIILGFIAIFLLIAAGFASAGDLTITDTVNTSGASSNPGASFVGSFKVNNINTIEAISNIDLSSSTFTTGANTIPSSAIVFSPDPISSIAAGGSQSVGFTVTMPSLQVPGTYSGTITAADALGNSTTTPISFAVNTFKKLEITDHSDSSPLIFSSENGKTVSGVFTLKNSGNVDLSFSDSSITHNVDLSDEDDDNITLSFSSITTALSPGATDSVTVTAVIPSDVDVGIYSGTVNVTSDTVAASFKLDIKVQPEVCKDGTVGNLDISVNDPDSGDEFAPGDKISVEASVENNDNDEMDVIVTAFLYNVDEDDNLVEEDSKTIQIGDGDEETFEFDLQLPFDGNLDENDEYILFVKSYEDGNEDDNCAEDSVDVDIQRENHDTRVEEFTLSPGIAVCDEVVEASVNILNIGSSNEDDVFVELKNTELGLREESEKFDLDDGDSNDNDASTSIAFTVPSDASEKSYQIEAVVHYDDDRKKASKFATLTVENCKLSEEEIPPEDIPKADIEVLATSIEAKQNTFSIPIKVTNHDEQSTYSIEMTNIDDWAESVSAKTLTLNKGQSSTIYFYIKANSDASGKQSATVNVKDAKTGNVVNTQTITLDLGSKEVAEPAQGLWDRLKGYFGQANSTVFWIILDVILVVVAIVFIKVLFTRRKQ